MDLLVVRHGQSEADLLEVMEGRANFSLTDLGCEQAKRMATWLHERFAIDAIIASPLKRTVQTAQALSELNGIELRYDDDLMEWQNGQLAGVKREEAAVRFPEPERKHPHTELYGYESLIQFRCRAETALSKIIYDHPPESTIAIFSHGGLINMLFRSFLRLPFGDDIFLVTGDTGIHHWRIDESSGRERRRVIFCNRQDHLQ